MKRVLIIEDDNVLRENMAELLEFENYNVSTATNGIIGIEKAKKELPDLIICDIMMPGLDGYAVLEAISLVPAITHIPFIFLSAKSEHTEIRKGMDLGADDYLTKPFEEDELLGAIESRLSKNRIRHKAKSSISKKNEIKEGVHNLNELKNLFDDTGEIRTYPKGKVIYKEGEHSHNIYLIIKGVVKSHKIEKNGKELITALYKSEDFLGLTSLADNLPYQETATAVDDVKLAGISKIKVKNIIGKDQNMSLELMGVLTKNISEIKEQLLHMAYSSVRKKTAQTILQFTRIMNIASRDAITISRSDLASGAGVATESLIRALSDFRKKGLIEIEDRKIKILQLKALEEMK